MPVLVATQMFDSHELSRQHTWPTRGLRGCISQLIFQVCLFLAPSLGYMTRKKTASRFTGALFGIPLGMPCPDAQSDIKDGLTRSAHVQGTSFHKWNTPGGVDLSMFLECIARGGWLGDR